MKRVLLILLLLLFAVSSRADTGLNWWQAFGVGGSGGIGTLITNDSSTVMITDDANTVLIGPP